MKILKKAIDEKNWDLVIQAYELLSGETYSQDEEQPPVKRKRGRPKKKSVETEPKIPKKRGRPPKTAKKKVVKADQGEKTDFSIKHGQPTKKTDEDKNLCHAAPWSKDDVNIQFFDDSSLFSDENVNEKPYLGTQKIRPRGTRTVSETTVVCSICGKTESVHTLYAKTYDPDPDENRYCCNSCIKYKGGEH